MIEINPATGSHRGSNRTKEELVTALGGQHWSQLTMSRKSPTLCRAAVLRNSVCFIHGKKAGRCPAFFLSLYHHISACSVSSSANRSASTARLRDVIRSRTSTGTSRFLAVGLREDLVIGPCRSPASLAGNRSAMPRLPGRLCAETLTEREQTCKPAQASVAHLDSSEDYAGLIQ